MAKHDTPPGGCRPVVPEPIERPGMHAGLPFEGGAARAISSFLDTTPFEMAMLFDAIDAGDTAEAGSLAASLQESCREIGATELAACLVELGTIASRGDRAGLRALRSGLGRECSRALEFLEARL